MLSACSAPDGHPLERQGNAVYYWRTAFMLDSVEQAFMHNYDIRCIYCRYFDVVMDGRQEPMPNATIRFSQTVPDTVEMVPTVFIMNDCMQSEALKNANGTTDPSLLARKIVDRIAQMNETNEITTVSEIQIDCDYTLRNRELYYRFLTDVRREARAHGWRLSTTIRLHQLSMPPPPADYGVLMLYNTGDPMHFAERRSADGRLLEKGRNPILDLRDVEPYLHYLKDYTLPMGAAYPTFVWNRTLHGVNISHTADFTETERVKRLVEAERSDLRQLILTYHLDNDNIKRYSPEQYEKIYRH